MPPAVRCSIPGANLKAFGKAIHNLARFGDDLYLEACQTGIWPVYVHAQNKKSKTLNIRQVPDTVVKMQFSREFTVKTANVTRSAYGCFKFSVKFFHSYDFGALGDTSIKCKITMKSCLNAFKSLNTMEKSVDQCELSMCPASSCLVLQLHCKHGMLKTYNIPYLEQEDLKAIFSRSPLAHTIVATPRTLAEVVVNFQMSQEEVTFIASTEMLIVKNYLDEDVDSNKALYTQMALKPEEFDSYQVTASGEITFCLKELRAILTFAESLNLPLEIQFETAGKPIMIFVRSDQLYEGSFVLATLADAVTPEDTLSSQPASSAVAVGGPNRSAGAAAVAAHPNGSKAVRSAKPNKDNPISDQQRLHDPMVTSILSVSDVSIFPVAASGPKKSQDVAAEDTPCSSAMAADDGNELLADEVASTPPRKKFKSFFLGVSQQSTSFHASQYPVLAEDTDDDGESDNG